jgi:hypothetical protein
VIHIKKKKNTRNELGDKVVSLFYSSIKIIKTADSNEHIYDILGTTILTLNRLLQPYLKDTMENEAIKGNTDFIDTSVKN